MGKDLYVKRKTFGCKKALKIGGKTFILDNGAFCLVYTIDRSINRGRRDPQ